MTQATELLALMWLHIIYLQIGVEQEHLRSNPPRSASVVREVLELGTRGTSSSGSVTSSELQGSWKGPRTIRCGSMRQCRELATITRLSTATVLFK